MGSLLPDPVKGVKDHGLIAVLVPEIALHHGELIEIGQERQVLSVHKSPPLEASGRRGGAAHDGFKNNLKNKAFPRG